MLVNVHEALRASALAPNKAAFTFAGAPSVTAGKRPSLWEGDVLNGRRRLFGSLAHHSLGTYCPIAKDAQ